MKISGSSSGMACFHIICRSSRGKRLNRVKTGAIVVEGGVVVVTDDGAGVAADGDSIVVEGAVDMMCVVEGMVDTYVGN
jgi:hypothetical protein